MNKLTFKILRATKKLCLNIKMKNLLIHKQPNSKFIRMTNIEQEMIQLIKKEIFYSNQKYF